MTDWVTVINPNLPGTLPSQVSAKAFKNMQAGEKGFVELKDATKQLDKDGKVPKKASS
jgi:hypothetical protein